MAQLGPLLRVCKAEVKVWAGAGLLHEAGDPLPGSLVAGTIHFLEAVLFIAACLFQASERESLTCF